MFKQGQVVALKLDFRDVPQYQKIVRIVGLKYYLSEDESNDPRLYYVEDEIRPLTQREIEGDV